MVEKYLRPPDSCPEDKTVDQVFEKPEGCYGCEFELTCPVVEEASKKWDTLHGRYRR
jgi:hypothetical protein